jgi:glycosyltransferase involved in cell wall biosynthesis
MQKLQTDTLQPIALPPLADNPLVSVLVPNYNYARYIGESLDSALSQTYPNFEVIVCDDGSKDNSCEVIESYTQKDSRIKLIRKPNGGVATALNAAYRESKGQIICILDADDVWIDNKLQKVVEVFRSDPKSGFAIHNVIQIDAQGNLIKSTPMLRRLASGWMALSALENGGFVYNIPPASALSLRREVADSIFPLNEEFKRNADSLIFRFAPFITVIGSAPEVLSKFRLHGANTTSFTNLTVDFLSKEQTVLERIHQEQKQFLQNFYGAKVAEELTDLKYSTAVCHDRYLLARFQKAYSQERREIYQRLINHPDFSNWSVAQQWLFKWGEYLPDKIFKVLFDQIYGSSHLKRLFRWFTQKSYQLSR